MTFEIVRKRGDWVAGIPGALALFAAIGLAVGIVDANMREQLPEVLVGCLVVMVVFGGLYFFLRQGLLRTLRLREGSIELLDRGIVTLEIEAPVIHHGVFIEHINLGAAARNAPVAWVSIHGAGRVIVVRKALGIHEAVPVWPSIGYQVPHEALYAGDPIRLYSALSRTYSSE